MQFIYFFETIITKPHTSLNTSLSLNLSLFPTIEIFFKRHLCEYLLGPNQRRNNQKKKSKLQQRISALDIQHLKYSCQWGYFVENSLAIYFKSFSLYFYVLDFGKILIRKYRIIRMKVI
jgi:hypothetical protein